MAPADNRHRERVTPHPMKTAVTQLTAQARAVCSATFEGFSKETGKLYKTGRSNGQGMADCLSARGCRRRPFGEREIELEG